LQGLAKGHLKALLKMKNGLENGKWMEHVNALATLYPSMQEAVEMLARIQSQK